MRLLLDSNIVVVLTRRELKRLGANIIDALESEENEVYVSAASLWEIAIKVRVGKLDPLLSIERIPEYVTNLGFSLLGVSPTHAVEDLLTIPATKDPFDRLLLAQCQVENFRLVTLDSILKSHPLAWRAS